MTEGDYRDRIGRQDFQVRLSEMSTDEIKFGLKTKAINTPDKVALAEIELDRRAEQSDLAQARRDLRKWRTGTLIAVIAAAAAVASAVASWMQAP